MNTKLKMLLITLLAALVCGLGSTAVFAQISQNAPPEEEVRIAPPNNPAGPYAKGSKSLNIVGGVGSTLGQSYMILGAGFSYYIANGLAIGISGEGWILQDPTFWKISPDLRYTFWKMDKIKPYVGVFYRHTFVGGDFGNYDSWGGRAGVAYRQGGSYVSLGVVYEEFWDSEDSLFDNSTTYPEISFWFSF